MVFHPKGRGEFGVAGRVYSANVGEFSEKAGQPRMNADMVDVGVFGRVCVDQGSKEKRIWR